MGTLVLRIIINAVAIYAITAGYLPGIRIVGVVAGRTEETTDRPRANS